MNTEIQIIGICGKSGSGKGYVCKVFERQGIPCVDTDLVYRELLDMEGSPCLSDIVSEYGNCVLECNGKLDRRALASIVFSDKSGQSLKKLNEITHKYILKETLSKIENYGKQGFKAIIIDAPVLFESRFNELCDLVFCVTAPMDVLVERICKRDNRSKSEAVARLENQMDETALVKLCNDIIVNDGTADVTKQVIALIKKYGLGGKVYE